MASTCGSSSACCGRYTGPAGYAGFLQLGECVGRVFRSAHQARICAQDGFAVITSRLIGCIQWIRGPTLLITHQPRPAPEQPVANHVSQDVAIGSRKHVGRRRGLHAVTGPDPVDSRRTLLNQMRTKYGKRRAQQRGLHLLALAGLRCGE